MGGIDYVVPMVFPDDEEWQKGFRKVGGAYREGNVRYRSWGTEEVLIKLVRKNMPWVRDIHILLAQESQRQAWMDGYGIKVVYHKEIMPEKYLPTFNSSAFEMFLHKIPGLSERFVYGNDDMYPLSPLGEDDFFQGELPCVMMVEREWPKEPTMFQKMLMNGQDFVAREFGGLIRDVLLRNGHSIAPILKSTCEHLWERKDEIEKSLSRFRAEYNFNQYIYSWWQWLKGEYVEYAPKRTYLGMSIPLEDILKVLRCANPGIVCINDDGYLKDHEEHARIVRKALEERL